MKTKLLYWVLALIGIATSSLTAQNTGCGGIFTTPEGPNANYANNSDYTVTICPSNPGEVVTVTFMSFNTESTFDGIYVYNGTSIASPQISSGNPIGNGPLTSPGAYWGNSIPGPFTSSSPDGCLTFRFLSDGSLTYVSWLANVTCAPAPSCAIPYAVSSSNSAQTSTTLNWIDTTPATAWEVFATSDNSITPQANTVGQLVTSHPAIITGLLSATDYNFFVRAICSPTDTSAWSNKIVASTLLSNDECNNATVIIPSYEHYCSQPVAGRLTGATPSTQPLDTSCVGTADDDVWFQFVANNSFENIALLNCTGSTNNINFAVYSGDCNSLSTVYCSPSNALSGIVTNLTVGQTYYLRVYSNANTPQSVTFNVCITIPSTCSNSESVCGISNYGNTTGVASLGTIGCLFTTPNPTFITVKISQSGPVNLTVTQAAIGSSVPNLDADFAAWGPFTDQNTACSFIGTSQPFPAPSIIGGAECCSYSTAATENLNIPQAQAGEYYIVLVTNFSNQPGVINITQANSNVPGAGSIDCSGIRLNAFIDYNSNGTQENGEPNFPLGQFHFEVNNNGIPHIITSPTGSYTIFDVNNSNTYNINYSIGNDYNSQYTTTTSYSNVSVSSGNMTTYNFPINSLQNYNDLGVTLVPLSAPRAGLSYKVKINYFNNGNQTIAAGSLTFNNNAASTIIDISQTGTTASTNGFSYSFSNLLPFETRTITVTLSVPNIPTVFLGQLLTDSVMIVPPTADILINNNNNAISQAVIGSYDPNDKTETHGEEILFSEFTSNDYLEYIIRFENNGSAGASTIHIDDVLGSQLDENSIVMLSASHNYSLDRLGNALTWNFNNINLPVSIPNTDIGKGFVKFKIKPKPGYAVGDIIPNTAQIYFDSNPAIVTNTFNTKFVTTLGNDLFTESSILLFPNPTTNLVQVTITNSPETIDTITIYDVLGKNVMFISAIASNQKTIDASALAKGIYLVEITTEHHFKQIKKLIVQ